MNRILVTYFSRTGYTRRVAEQLARALDATLCRIKETRSRMGFLGYSCCLWEATFDIDPQIKPITYDPAKFDLVVIGTPVWGWQLASPTRAFARTYRSQIKRAAFFCTMGGSGAQKAFAELQRALGMQPVATLALTDPEIDANTTGPKLTAFVEALLAADSESPVSSPRPAARPAHA
jgi:menaquinone-dependent protoporphyrinogen IX oxidase